jgi:hypothetical protein
VSDPNPYESPKSDEPLQPGQLVKRGIGAGTIGCLMPVAVIVTGWISCDVSMHFARVSRDRSDGASVVVIWVLILLLPPVAVLVAMLWWRQRANDREHLGRDAKQTED